MNRKLTREKWTSSDKLSYVRYPDEEVAPGRLSVFHVVYNMHGEEMPWILLPDLIPLNLNTDFIVIGTSECSRTIAKSFMNSDKSEWEKQCSLHLNGNYTLITSECLVAMHIMVFARNKLVPYIGNVVTDTLSLGVGNILGNKGAVFVSLDFLREGLVPIQLKFVQVHLDAHMHNAGRRANQLEKILLKLEGEVVGSIHSGVIFLGGDFNFRIHHLTRGEFDRMYSLGMREELLANDEGLEMSKMFGMKEGLLLFKPTYKFGTVTGENQESVMVYDRQRIPAWTDRVFVKSICSSEGSAERVQVMNMFYDCNSSIKISDHLPVVSQFEITIPSARAKPVKPSVTEETEIGDQNDTRACSIS
jgi:hypothetical protein